MKYLCDACLAEALLNLTNKHAVKIYTYEVTFVVKSKCVCEFVFVCVCVLSKMVEVYSFCCRVCVLLGEVICVTASHLWFIMQERKIKLFSTFLFDITSLF